MDEQPTALEDPWTIVEEFRNAAVKAKEADFDGVESKLSPKRSYAHLLTHFQCTLLTVSVHFRYLILPANVDQAT
jgi:hypothetical protein